MPHTSVAAPDAFALNLKRVRLELGLTKVEVARRSRISIRAIDRIEAGDNSPSLRTAYALARAVGCSLQELASQNTRPGDAQLGSEVARSANGG